MLGEYRVENFIRIKIFKNLKITRRGVNRNLVNGGSIYTLPCLDIGFRHRLSVSKDPCVVHRCILIMVKYESILVSCFRRFFFFFFCFFFVNFVFVVYMFLVAKQRHSFIILYRVG